MLKSYAKVASEKARPLTKLALSWLDKMKAKLNRQVKTMKLTIYPEQLNSTTHADIKNILQNQLNIPNNEIISIYKGMKCFITQLNLSCSQLFKRKTQDLIYNEKNFKVTTSHWTPPPQPEYRLRITGYLGNQEDMLEILKEMGTLEYYHFHKSEDIFIGIVDAKFSSLLYDDLIYVEVMQIDPMHALRFHWAKLTSKEPHQPDSSQIDNSATPNAPIIDSPTEIIPPVTNHTEPNNNPNRNESMEIEEVNSSSETGSPDSLNLLPESVQVLESSAAPLNSHQNTKDLINITKENEEKDNESEEDDFSTDNEDFSELLSLQSKPQSSKRKSRPSMSPTHNNKKQNVNNTPSPPKSKNQ